MAVRNPTQPACAATEICVLAFGLTARAVAVSLLPAVPAAERPAANLPAADRELTADFPQFRFHQAGP